MLPNIKKDPSIQDHHQSTSSPLRFGAVYIIFVLLGTGTLLPFNVFLTEKEFYDVRLQVR